VATALAKKLPWAAVYNCCSKTFDGEEKRTEPQISDYSKIVLGSAMYMGSPMSAFKKFVAKHKEALAQRPLSFFSCGLGTQEEDKPYLLKSLPEALKAKELPYRHMGGEIRPEQMSGFAKLAMKEYEKKNGAAPGIDWNAVDELAREMSLHLGGAAI
jgi:menaquinone-dependent protoporphyrinogen IX oxidase